MLRAIAWMRAKGRPARRASASGAADCSAQKILSPPPPSTTTSAPSRAAVRNGKSDSARSGQLVLACHITPRRQLSDAPRAGRTVRPPAPPGLSGDDRAGGGGWPVLRGEAGLLCRLSGGSRALPAETRVYVASVACGGAAPADAPARSARNALFAVREGDAVALPDRTQRFEEDGLFAVAR